MVTAEDLGHVVGESQLNIQQFVGRKDEMRKLLRLLDQTRRCKRIGFWRVDQIEAKEVLLLANARVKAVAIISRIHDQSAILEDDPIFRCVAAANVAFHVALTAVGLRSNV